MVPVLVPYEAGQFVRSNVNFTAISVFACLGSLQEFDTCVHTEQILTKMNCETPQTTALMEAAVEGDLLSCKYLVNREAGLQDPASGETALMRCLTRMYELTAKMCTSDGFERAEAGK